MPINLTNFGHNVFLRPTLVVVPTDNNDVLACLEQHRGRKIRVLGSLHSWSEVALADDIAVDVRNLDKVAVHTDADGQVFADIGAGCTIDRVLDYLDRNGGYTLPVYGVVGKQTIAGAISTATHGSGRASLSHYVVAVTVAAYDPATGKPRVYEWSQGDALLAARCGLGCTGVLLSVRMLLEKDYYLEERTQWYDHLDELLADSRDYARHQFYLMPWSWRWYAQLRRRVADSGGIVPGAMAWLLRLFRRAVIDALLHGAIYRLTADAKSLAKIPWLFRRVLPLIAPGGIRVADRSRELLMMRHDLYRHVECELFVPASQLSRAAAYIEWVLRSCAGESDAVPNDLATVDFGGDVVAKMQALCGSYRHDYLITFRRVLRDETLISMTSGDIEVWYAISFITYQRDLEAFCKITRFLAVTMTRAFGARPHWGKMCPLSAAEFEALYPGLSRFRAHCASVDPRQVFVSDFARHALRFTPPAAQASPARTSI